MAKSSKFGFTNTTASTKVTITPIDVKVVDNYALKEDEPTRVVEDNKTCPLDQPEVVSFMCRDIPHVNTSIVNQYPAPVSNGVQYIISLEEILSTTDDTVPGYRVDDPIVASLTIRHPKSGNITANHIQTVLNRLLGMCYKTDGTSRFDDLMRSALKPSSN